MSSYFQHDSGAMGAEGGSAQAVANGAPGVTVTIPLSGPHRLAWLEEAIRSVPLEHPRVQALHIVCSGGPWDWAPALRASIQGHPKVRVFEYPERLTMCASLNRVVGTATSKWVLLLPDDDALIRAHFARALDESDAALDSQAGLIAYGWCYLFKDRFRADHVRRTSVHDIIRYTPKFCTTLIHAAHFRAMGGFNQRFEGYSDAAAFGRLVHLHGGWISSAHVGIYRMHEGQLSVERHEQLYLTGRDPTIAELSSFVPEPEQRQQVATRVRAHAGDAHATYPHRLRRIVYWLRSGPRPAALKATPRLWPWQFASAR